MSTALWPERSEVDTADRAELLQYIKGELFQTPKLRCDHRARTQVCATAGTSTLACRTDRRSRTSPDFSRWKWLRPGVLLTPAARFSRLEAPVMSCNHGHASSAGALLAGQITGIQPSDLFA